MVHAIWEQAPGPSRKRRHRELGFRLKPLLGDRVMKLKKLLAGLVAGLALAAGSQAQQVLSFEDDDIDFGLRPVAGVLTPIAIG
jgi:hypothetical protein